MDDDRLNRVEQLLRAERRDLLSGDFTQKVMSRICRLPDPALLRQDRGWLYTLRVLSTGEKLAAATVLLGLVLLLVPGAADALGGLGWELEAFSVELSLGGSALSASLASVATTVCCVLLLLGLGAYGARNRLIAT
ncbi:MAG TPA: hypothetical protein ENO21_00055 [Firmicutes bacterium]|nr:hypothetical protein [Bacillota bacterium]